MKNIGFGAATAAFMLAVAAPAQAELVSAENPQAIAAILSSQGLPTELLTPDDKNPYIESKHSGMKFLVLFMNCNDDNRACKTVQFYMGYNDAKNTTLDKLNDWNKEKRFARAYRDDEGDPVLEMDVDLDFKGIPRENVGEAVNTWKSLMDSFQKHIHGK